MVNYFWTKSQIKEMNDICHEYHFPKVVQEHMISIIQILDKYYGEGRNMESDGGFVAVLVDDDADNVEREYGEILGKYNVHRDAYEFSDILYKDVNGEYRSDLYIVTNDFGITIIWHCKEGR